MGLLADIIEADIFATIISQPLFIINNQDQMMWTIQELGFTAHWLQDGKMQETMVELGWAETMQDNALTLEEAESFVPRRDQMLLIEPDMCPYYV